MELYKFRKIFNYNKLSNSQVYSHKYCLLDCLYILTRFENNSLFTLSSF